MPLIDTAEPIKQTIDMWSATELGQRSFVLRTYVIYREADVPAFSKGLREWLTLRYGEENLSMGFDIPPFVKADDYLRERIGRADVVFILIGPAWLDMLQNALAGGADDRVYKEIIYALHDKQRVIPIYVRGAEPPAPQALPDELHRLLELEPVVIESWRVFYDELSRIVDRMRDELSPAEKAVEIWTDVLEKKFREFEAAYEAREYRTAMEHLQEISIHEVPRPFRSQLVQYIRKTSDQLQIENARPIYAHIISIADADPNQAWQALSLLMTEYPAHGDPDHLLRILQPRNAETDQLIALLRNKSLSGEERLRIGYLLADNDPRLGVGLRPDGTPDLNWSKVPAGDFLFYYDKQVFLPDFYISRYPITYRQFQTFIDDGGYENRAYWQGLDHHESHPAAQQWQYDNNPRERVSWYDAVAFCRWFSEREGYEIRLPTEEEWEKAARSSDARIYPWGDDYITNYANINEIVSGFGPNNLRCTTAVGVYPQAASPYGVEDLIGNVWEWCLNAFDRSSYIGLEGNYKRAMRGGSWDSDRLFAHTIRRRAELPGARLNIVGFRVVAERLPSAADIVTNQNWKEVG